jgi:hypothetical protein
MLPSFLVIGATKSGTTALYDYLRQHPAIFMPALKEPRFFLYDGSEDSARFPVRSLEEYEALFAPVTTETALGEATPQYLTSWAAMERIHETLPGARLIAALRDPAERAFSIYLMNLRNRGHNREIPFAEALGDDINLRRGYCPISGAGARFSKRSGSASCSSRTSCATRSRPRAGSTAFSGSILPMCRLSPAS